MALQSSAAVDDEVVDRVIHDEKYRAQSQKIEELNLVIDGLFANEVREIYWKEEVDKSRKEKEEAESKYADAVAKYESAKADTMAKCAAEIEALKSEHSSTVAELENAYEGRLASLADKIKSQERERREIEECRLKDMRVRDEEHQAHVTKLISSSHNSENKLQEQIDSLKVEVDTSEKMRREMLSKQEDEYENELSQQCYGYQKRLEDKQNAIDDVNVQVQKLVAKRAWLERQSKELKSQVIDIQNERLEATQHSKKLEGEIDRIQRILKQKDEFITRLKQENDAANIEKKNLDKELYITRTKCEELETERAPLERRIQGQNDEAINLMKRLHASQSEKEVLEQTVEVHEQKIRTRDSEIKLLRNAIRNRERKLKSIEGELVQLAGISDDKTLRKQVKIVYHKLNPK